MLASWSSAWLRAVGIALAILAATAIVQTVIFVASGSVALLADLIHNAGLDVADPLIGLAITLVILRITWQSWRTVRNGDTHHHRPARPSA